MDTDERMELILRNIKEYFGEDVDKMRRICNARPLEIYWGTAPTGRIHIGYLVPLLKIADFIDAGCNVTILLADIHAVLDNMKSSYQQAKVRANYYKIVISELLKILKVDVSRIRFVLGSEFQYSRSYIHDMFTIHTMVTVNTAKHAGADVVKKSDTPLITGLLYPSLQALDEVHLKADIQFGGYDQRKIFVHAREIIPKLKKNPFDDTLKYHKRIHIMCEMVPGLTSKPTKGENTKMSASCPQTKIDVLDTPEIILKKINLVYCLSGDIEDNSLMRIIEQIVFPILKRTGGKFIIDREEKYGGKKYYSNVDMMKKDFEDKNLHPKDVKQSLSSILSDILLPIKKKFEDEELQKLLKICY